MRPNHLPSGLDRAARAGLRSRRIRRRRLLSGAAAGAAGLAGAALVGCGADDTVDGPAGTQSPAATARSTSRPAASEPRRGGTLRVAMVPADTLDPAYSLNSSENFITMATHDNLVLRRHDLSLKPMLTESWEPNEDLTAYVFHLRSGVKFHHGKPFTAEDVVFTLNRLLDPDVGSPARSALSSIEAVTAVDERTVRLDLQGPNAFLPDTLSLYQGRMLPSDIDPERFAAEEFGTGAFILKEHMPGDRTTFRRNPEYWDERLPYVDELVFFHMSDPTSRMEALKGGRVDAVWPLEPSNVLTLERAPGVTVSETASAGYLNLAMRVDMPPFDDLRVRRAVQAVIDRGLVRDAALFDRGEIGNDHPIPPFDPHWWDGQEIGRGDVEVARRLLEEAGHGRGLDLTLHTSTVSPGMVELAVTFKEMAAPAGIRVEIRQQPEDSYWSEIWLKEAFTTVGWNGRNPDQALSIVYRSDAEWNESNYHSPELDDLIELARGQGDLEERAATYAQIQRKLIDDVPRPIPVFKPIFGGHRNKVRGLAAHPSNWLLVHEAWLDA